MSTSRITHLGYAAVSNGNTDLLRQPRTLAELPVRVSAGLGAIYFLLSFILLQAGGAAKDHALPILGILAALGVFIYRTAMMVAAWRYRRRLRTHARNGTIVFVPLGLLRHVQEAHHKQGKVMSETLFDSDLHRTAQFVELYKKEQLSPGVDKALREFTS